MGQKILEPLIFEVSTPGRVGYSLPPRDLPNADPAALFPARYVRDDIPGLPEVSEVDVVRHFTRLSKLNYGVDDGLYPLGSCTMKYNPKVNEAAAQVPGFLFAHPQQPEELAQGLLHLMWDLEQHLAAITGMAAYTLQPAAGAQGELVGLMITRAYLTRRGNPRRVVLIPDTAHGTNPASSTLNGYRVITVTSGPNGILTPDRVRAAVTEDVAALMLTNPNTLGLFEEHVHEIAALLHEAGALLYMDGANMNALLGRARPGDMGVDILHLNLHKTFSTPHGGGGPGAGPLGVRADLAPFLPVPRIVRSGDRFRLLRDVPESIGKVRAFYGNVGMLVRAYAYILSLGPDGLKSIADIAVANANYIKDRLKDVYHLPYDRPCMHECVLSDRKQAPFEVRTVDIAKRLMDYGFHPPTIYFPLVVPGALMIEPTESESREGLDRFVAAMRAIAEEAESDPALVRGAPHTLKVARLDEVRAARKPILRYRPA